METIAIAVFSIRNIEYSTFCYIVAGYGLFGAVMAEKIASVLQQLVWLIEKRNHIGGDCYSKTDEETGIEYHAYGTPSTALRSGYCVSACWS